MARAYNRRMSEAVEHPAKARVRRPRSTAETVRLVIGEILITSAFLIALFVGWKVWFNDVVFGASQSRAAEELSEEWRQQPEPEPAASTAPNKPAVLSGLVDGKAFGTIMIPRLGDDYRRPIAEGTGNNVLNTPVLGVGHYSKTQVPGQDGNIVLASHRTAYGGAFHNIHELRVGDHVYLETKDGWYQYTYRNTEYVLASQVEVLSPVPMQPGVEPTDSVLTLTTCNPFLSTAERIIVYNVFTEWFPRSKGAPEEIAHLMKKKA